MASLPSSSTTSSDPAAPPPTSSWVILGTIPRVVHGGGDKIPDMSLSLTAPPRVSLLNVCHRVAPRRPTPHNFPFLLAADSSGLLLLSDILGFPRSIADYPDRPDVLCSRWRENDARLFVLDATTGSTLRLPNPEPKKPIEHQALVGVLAHPGGGGGGFTVAELAPVVGSDEADLRCYSSDLGAWVTKAVHYPLPARPLEPICTISHQGKLWWADYSWGIINADPCADDPVLGFVPLPHGCVLERWWEDWCRGQGYWFELDKSRFVGVSAGNLRFVCLDSIKWRLANKITVWTLLDENSIEWRLEHEATFADIWADESYKATGLPKEPPVLALIHPHNPAVVYFFLDGHLFGIDVAARKVVECDRYHLAAPPHDYGGASRFVRAWELPPAVSSALGNWSRDISSEPNEAPPSRQSMPGDYRLMGHTRMSTFLV